MEKEEWRESNNAQRHAPYGALIERSNKSELPQRLNESGAIRLFVDPRVQSAIDRMARDWFREYSPDDLAGAACLSPSRFRHLFKEETGLTLTQYLKQMRVQAMCEKLLTEPYKTVSQIMGEVGAKDESHFLRDFKAACGLTPLEYRRFGLAALFLMIIFGSDWVRLQNSHHGQ